MVAGIILGPSIMGRLPGFTDTVFPDSSLEVFGVVANLGLILFMFIIGLEVDPGLLSANIRSSLIISFSAMLAPFFLGLVVSVYIHQEVQMVSRLSPSWVAVWWCRLTQPSPPTGGGCNILLVSSLCWCCCVYNRISCPGPNSHRPELDAH